MPLPKNITPIGGHISQATAYVTHDYPYGRLRCEMRFWVDSRPKFGQRLMMQSVNPKNGRENKPHAGNYHAIVCLFINNDNGHCEHWVIGDYNNTKTQLEQFETVFGSVMSDAQKNTLKSIRRANVFQSPVSFFELKEEQEKAIAALKAKIIADYPDKLTQMPDRSKAYLQGLELIIGFAPIPA
jgi:hypothetical protein